MKKISAVFVFSLALSGFLWAQSEEPIAAETETSSVLFADTAPTTSNFHQEGVASWYGAEFAGRATASGEIFDPAQFTAAHADLPFGTHLVVTNTENGKKIAVRVNDRGPFVRSRILDVSRAAAERLDMLTAGTAKVVVESTAPESAQSLMRELGVNATIAGATPAASRTTAPASSGSTAAAPPSPQTPAPRTTAPASPGSTAAAPSSPQTPAPRTTAPASSENATATAAPPSPQTPASRTTAPASSENATATAVPPSPQTPASRTNATGTPVMAPAAPRTPVQPPVTAPVPIPSASVSRVTGQVENIPEIRRPSDPGYIVVDEQVPPTVAPRTTPPVIAPASPAALQGAPTPVVAPATPAAASPAPAPSSVPAASPLAAAPRTPALAEAVPAVTPVPTEPQPSQPLIEANPAASVPVTGPRPGAEKIEFTGSPIIQGKNYRVQVGSFADLKNASDVFLKLFDAGLNPSYEPYEDKDYKYYRVVITNVKAEDADDLSRKLAEIGITEALAREDANR